MKASGRVAAVGRGGEGTALPSGERARAATTNAERKCLRASLPIDVTAHERSANDMRGSTSLPADRISHRRVRAANEDASVESKIPSAKEGSIAPSPPVLPTDGAASGLQRPLCTEDGRRSGGADSPGGASSMATADESAPIPRRETFPTAEEPAQRVRRARPGNENASRARCHPGAVWANLEPDWDAESLRALVDLFRLLNAWYEEGRR